MTEPRKVSVDLGVRAYDIIIGPNVLDRVNHWLSPIVGDGRVHIVTDATVETLHGHRLNSLLNDHSKTVLPAGEAQKSFTTLQMVLDDMFKAGLGRNDCVIAFGGGVIGDLTGFAASIFKRGCRFIQIPTTLLSQVDSSVGGKTAINVPQGKNLVGAFYQPELVLADTRILSTLPERELKAGYAEIVKYGLLGDVAFFNWLKANGSDVLSLSPKAITHAISVSCETKARIVAADEQERGQRALLNLGHTFAHSLEAESGYGGDLLHGEAVSAGMQMAFEFSQTQGLCSKTEVEQVIAHLEALKMPTIKSVTNLLKSDRLLTHMQQDKKNESGRLTLILVRGIGEAFVRKDVSLIAVEKYLQGLQHTYG